MAKKIREYAKKSMLEKIKTFQCEHVKSHVKGEISALSCSEELSVALLFSLHKASRLSLKAGMVLVIDGDSNPVTFPVDYAQTNLSFAYQEEIILPCIDPLTIMEFYFYALEGEHQDSFFPAHVSAIRSPFYVPFANIMKEIPELTEEIVMYQEENLILEVCKINAFGDYVSSYHDMTFAENDLQQLLTVYQDLLEKQIERQKEILKLIKGKAPHFVPYDPEKYPELRKNLLLHFLSSVQMAKLRIGRPEDPSDTPYLEIGGKVRLHIPTLTGEYLVREISDHELRIRLSCYFDADPQLTLKSIKDVLSENFLMLLYAVSRVFIEYAQSNQQLVIPPKFFVTSHMVERNAYCR
jgi:hypothetical protein